MGITGIIRSGFSLGSVFGIYVGQNYNVPDIHELFRSGLVFAKNCEEKYRKPKKKDDGDSVSSSLSTITRRSSPRERRRKMVMSKKKDDGDSYEEKYRKTKKKKYDGDGDVKEEEGRW